MFAHQGQPDRRNVKPKYDQKTFPVADYPEQIEALKPAGVDNSWDHDTEAGTGFAERFIG